MQKKNKVVKMSTFWDDPPPNCENSQPFFPNEYFPYPIEGEWEYFLAHFPKRCQKFHNGINFWYMEGQSIIFLVD